MPLHLLRLYRWKASPQPEVTVPTRPDPAEDVTHSEVPIWLVQPSEMGKGDMEPTYLLISRRVPMPQRPADTLAGERDFPSPADEVATDGSVLLSPAITRRE
jgi:hypothetical protein